MLRRYYSLIMMGFWLVISACLLAPDLILPQNARRHIGGLGGTFTGLLALMFALYNFVRWWALRSLIRTRSGGVNPLSVRRRDSEAEEKYEPNPELDFFKVSDADKPNPPAEPSVNGDHLS